ncbi:MAG: response regulator, partial [Deltaproteobacteria bacterium]|nr:response regulator [Deltaproteobacteria bacterium]
MSSILVLDDVVDAGNLIKRILEKKGHDVFVFTEEEDAINHVKFNETDLAILDLKLKKMSGIDVLEKLKSISP